MTTCAHVACDRSTRARGLCEMHYGQLKRAGLPPAVRRQPRQASGLQLDCQLGRNTRCVDCGDLPFGGGMRCLTCFQHRVSVRLDTETAHECVAHMPSTNCYRTCRCRCRECREAVTEQKQRARRKVAV
jgi:hypothetical protein